MKTRKAIFAINSDKSKAIFIQEIPLDNAPTPDTFPWWNGVMLVVCTTNENVVDWFIDGNPYIRIIEEEPNDYRLIRIQHSPAHYIGGNNAVQDAFKQLAIERTGGNIAGAIYSIPNCVRDNCSIH